MILRAITGAVFALAIAASPALACKGTEIFSDDFQNSDGPWDSAEWIKIGGGFAELTLPPTYGGVMRYLADPPPDFDLCVDITYPSISKPDGGGIGGIALWFKEFQDTYLVGTTPAGVMGALRIRQGKPLLLSPVRKYAAIKTGAGAKNTFRVTVKGNTVTMYANDQRTASFRGTPGEGTIGLFAESPQDGASPWKFSSFKLTEAP